MNIKKFKQQIIYKQIKKWVAEPKSRPVGYSTPWPSVSMVFAQLSNTDQLRAEHGNHLISPADSGLPTPAAKAPLWDCKEEYVKGSTNSKWSPIQPRSTHGFWLKLPPISENLGSIPLPLGWVETKHAPHPPRQHHICLILLMLLNMASQRTEGRSQSSGGLLVPSPDGWPWDVSGSQPSITCRRAPTHSALQEQLFCNEHYLNFSVFYRF